MEAEPSTVLSVTSSIWHKAGHPQRKVAFTLPVGTIQLPSPESFAQRRCLFFSDLHRGVLQLAVTKFSPYSVIFFPAHLCGPSQSIFCPTTHSFSILHGPS